MDILIIITLLTLGIFLLIVELFLLPGFGIAGITALLFVGGGIYYAYTVLGTLYGTLILIGAILITLLLIIILIRSKALDKMALTKEIEGNVNTDISTLIKVGEKAITLTRLNPMGSILLGDMQVDAKSQNEYIEEQTPVEIIEIGRNCVTVKSIPQTPKNDNN